MKSVLYSCRTCKKEKPRDGFATRSERRAFSCLDCDAGMSSKVCARCKNVFHLSELRRYGASKQLNSYCLRCRRETGAENQRKRRSNGKVDANEAVHGRMCRSCRRRKPWEEFAAFNRKVCVECDEQRTLRTCEECGEARLLLEFVKCGTTHAKSCRTCAKVRHRKATIKQFGEESAARIEKHGFREWRKIYAAIRRYGITYEQYVAIYESHGGLCAICGDPETHTINGQVKRLAIDHCHETSRIRGLLCHKCNRALGLMMDNPEWLRRAAEYIEKGRASSLISKIQPRIVCET